MKHEAMQTGIVERLRDAARYWRRRAAEDGNGATRIAERFDEAAARIRGLEADALADSAEIARKAEFISWQRRQIEALQAALELGEAEIARLLGRVDHYCEQAVAAEAALARARAEALEEAAKVAEGLDPSSPMSPTPMFALASQKVRDIATAIRSLSERGGVGGASPAGTVCSPPVGPCGPAASGASPTSRTHGEG